MKKAFLCALTLAVAGLSQTLASTLIIDAAYLKTSAGVKIGEGSGLLLLVASTGNQSFVAPTSTAFVSGDDVELGRWSLSGGGEPGAFSQTIVLNLTGGVAAGNPVQLMWFPTLGIGATAPGDSTTYGVYRSPITSGTDADGSAPWVIPGAAATENIKFFTSDFGSLVNTATSGVNFGEAALVIPEPSSLVLLALAMGGGLLFVRRRVRSQSAAIAN